MNPAVPPSRLDQAEWTRGVVHELLHAYDACRADLDPSNCSHVACTEIRAANLSGDCDFGAEFSRRAADVLLGGSLAARQQACVRRRAELSVAMHAQCAEGGPTAVAAHVQRVWAPCYADTAPFATN
jgi:mitochondrial inner membrane protease ATP23